MKNSTKFTASETEEAIKKSKPSKSLGPDNISTLHLKHLGPKGIEYLTSIFNLSMSTSQIPAIWKTSTIIPLLKPKKPSDESSSYRPVSLLCPSIKVLERLVLPALKEHLPVPDIQHGFREKHSTVTALHEFNQHVSDGFNQKKPAHRTVLLQIDLSKAFDMVNHNKLLNGINSTNLPDFIKRWLNCYLRGRQSKVKFRNTTSKSRNVKTGVPQGAVTSPILFNFYLNCIPAPPAGIKLVQYADDISVYASGTSIDALASLITKYTKELTDFLTEMDLIVSAEKSTVTLFTPDTHEAHIHPTVHVQGEPVRLEKHPKLLGVTFDTMLKFSKHTSVQTAKAKTKLNAIKAISGAAWGQDKDTLLTTYKAICRSTLEYAAPIWAPAISESNWTRLQSVQNQALRTATGCLAMTSIDHLHQESKVLPVKVHSTMITKQFLAAFHQNNHPGNKYLNQQKPPRNLRKTLLDHEPEIREKYRAGNLYKDTLKSIHTETVHRTISSYPPNRVLQTQPPEINKEERDLDRKTRTRLARLRSGFCRSLKSYMSRIDDQETDSCPLCHVSPHDTLHLFNCSENPTDLSPIDLWTRPKLAANFLKLPDG